MHKQTMLLLLAAIGVCGCRCHREPNEVRRPEDDAKVVVHDAAPKPKVLGPRFVLVRTDLVDLEAKTAMPWFGPKPPTAWAADETNVFVGNGETIRAAAPPEKGTTWTDTM